MQRSGRPCRQPAQDPSRGHRLGADRFLSFTCLGGVDGFYEGE